MLQTHSGDSISSTIYIHISSCEKEHNITITFKVTAALNTCRCH